MSEVVLHRRVQLWGVNAGRRGVRGGRTNSGEAAVIGGDDLFGYLPPAGSPLPKKVASSDKEGARRRWCGAGEFNSGERMLAGGGCVAGIRTPAKPR